MTRKKHIQETLEILASLNLPKEQQNERSALCLLALLDMTPDKDWRDANGSLIGITPIMDWARKHWRKKYAPNTRETIRRQSMHQFVDAGIALYNPDEPGRAVNSPRAVYQIAPECLSLLKLYGSPGWADALASWLAQQGSLAERYANAREQMRVPVQLASGKELSFSAGEHSALIAAVVTDFAPHFAPGSSLLYAGDTENKWAHFDQAGLAALGVTVDAHGKMPDVVLHFTKKDWLLLVECVTSHGPVNAKRHAELAKLFAGSTAGLVYVTAFPNRSLAARHLTEIAWETEIWLADAPTHLIHLNGERFLGPYKT